jgi:hypothetical protein
MVHGDQSALPVSTTCAGEAAPLAGIEFLCSRQRKHAAKQRQRIAKGKSSSWNHLAPDGKIQLRWRDVR